MEHAADGDGRGSTFRAVVNDSCAYCAVRTACPISGKGRQVTDEHDRPASDRGSPPTSCASRLGLTYQFSDEQLEVISAPPDEPLLVVAGAGSGKTELMALRVVWLIANAHVRPDQVLGLTFTRKAAGELSHRIRLYLGRAKALLGHDGQLMGEPTVSTYHSFAARIVREHGMRAGYEPNMRLLTEAACWQLADAAVRQHDSPGMRAYPFGQASATAACSTWPASWPSTCATPRTSPGSRSACGLRSRAPARTGSSSRCRTCSTASRAGSRCCRWSTCTRSARRRMEAMDFGDQLRRAAIVARDHPEVAAGRAEPVPGRAARRVPGHVPGPGRAAAVAVRRRPSGDRGRRPVPVDLRLARRQRRHARPVPGRLSPPSGADADLRWLTVSWRNAPDILAVANRVSDPLRGQGAPVKPLRAAATYTPKLAGSIVRAAFTRTYLDEAAWIGDQIVAAWQEWQHRYQTTPTSAVLVRARSQIATLELALRERGLPVEVVGLGGLLDTPEVRDVVCTMQVLADPTEGAALLRLLTGARWRIGPRDVVALYRRARRIAPPGGYLIARPASPPRPYPS